MTATGHAIIGTVIAAKVGNPALAVPIALASHVAADALPHWDTGTNSRQKSKTKFILETAFDVLLGFSLAFFLKTLLFPAASLSYTFFIVIAAQLFDWLTAPYLFLGMKFAPFSWFYRFQKVFDNRLDMPWGVVDQVALILIIIAFGKLF